MYYSTERDVNEKGKKIFLLRYEHPTSSNITNDGPFRDEGEASDKLFSFLKKGICSWLVTYYD